MADNYKLTPFRHSATPAIIRPGLVPKIENKRGYTYSYSGSDCRAYCWFDSDNSNQVWSLPSLATISLSIHEAKSPVRRLGHRNVSGYTEAIRTIAGSLVLTIVEDHPLKMLIEKNNELNSGYSLDKGTYRLSSAVTLDPINILLKYKTEIDVNGGNSTRINRVRFLNEGVVTSVNDMVTEMVCQFVAEDAVVFDMESTFTTQQSSMKSWNKVEQSAKENLEAASQLTGELINKAGQVINEAGQVTIAKADELLQKIHENDLLRERFTKPENSFENALLRNRFKEQTPYLKFEQRLEGLFQDFYNNKSYKLRK